MKEGASWEIRKRTENIRNGDYSASVRRRRVHRQRTIPNPKPNLHLHPNPRSRQARPLQVPRPYLEIPRPNYPPLSPHTGRPKASRHSFYHPHRTEDSQALLASSPPQHHKSSSEMSRTAPFSCPTPRPSRATSRQKTTSPPFSTTLPRPLRTTSSTPTPSKS